MSNTTPHHLNAELHKLEQAIHAATVRRDLKKAKRLITRYLAQDRNSEKLKVKAASFYRVLAEPKKALFLLKLLKRKTWSPSFRTALEREHSYESMLLLTVLGAHFFSVLKD